MRDDFLHRIALPRTYAVLGHIVASVFAECGLPAALLDGDVWYPIHEAPSVLRFEIAHGVGPRRWAYNDRSMARLRRQETPLLAKHAGFFDLFIPVRNPKGSCSALVTGPFSLKRATTQGILRRWRSVTGRPANSSDPELLHYAETTLSTATFDEATFSVFKRLLVRFSMLLEGRGDTDELAAEIAHLRGKLRKTTLFARMSREVHDIIDDRTTIGATGLGALNTLRAMGLDRSPEHVLVGLLVGPSREVDQVESLVRRDAFQRACTEIVIKRTGALCAPMADYGIALVSDETGSGNHLRRKLGELGSRVRALAMRFGYQLHVGICTGVAGTGLPFRYRAALAAAEKGLSQGLPLVHADHKRVASTDPMRMLRRALSQVTREDPKLLRPEFDRYLAGLTAHCGGRIEPIRAHLEAAFDLVADALRATGVLEDRSLLDFELKLGRAAANVRTVGELSAAYREVLTDISAALLRPRDARRDGSLRRAMDYIGDHFAEPLRLAKVAGIAGFAPTHFSRLFADAERVTFGQYVRKLRIDRAKHMLTATTLNVERIGQLCGFPSRTRFHVVFKTASGVTPQEYRKGYVRLSPGRYSKGKRAGKHR